MFKVYVDMLKSDKQRVKGGQSVKFGYLSMMVVTTLGVLNVESFIFCGYLITDSVYGVGLHPFSLHFTKKSKTS
jgi:hypothetical protein